jgi:hypothetical protein
VLLYALLLGAWATVAARTALSLPKLWTPPAFTGDS